MTAKYDRSNFGYNAHPVVRVHLRAELCRLVTRAHLDSFALDFLMTFLHLPLIDTFAGISRGGRRGWES